MMQNATHSVLRFRHGWWFESATAVSALRKCPRAANVCVVAINTVPLLGLKKDIKRRVSRRADTDCLAGVEATSFA